MFRAILVTFALGVSLGCGIAVWEWLNPLNGHIGFGFSETYYRRSAASTDPAKKIIWAKAAIEAAPHRAENWMLLASAYQSQDKKISPRTIDALRVSYHESALSADVSRWRLGYVFSNWGAMPNDVRAYANTEAKVVSSRYSEKQFLQKLDESLPDESARLSLGLILLRSNHPQG